MGWSHKAENQTDINPKQRQPASSNVAMSPIIAGSERHM